MTQDEIFKLLLIILLLANESCCEQNSSLCSINEIIIAVLLVNAFSGNFLSSTSKTGSARRLR